MRDAVLPSGLNENIWFGQKTPLDVLYHYTSSNTFLEYIAPKVELRLSTFDRMNDPREHDSWRFDCLNPRGDDFIQRMEGLNADIRSRARLACFCRDEDLPGGQLAFHDVAYARGFSRPRMWAQYGGNYTGVCLLFDRHKLLSLFESFAREHGMDLMFGVVDYANRRPVGGLFRVDAFTVVDDHYFASGAVKYAKLHCVAHHRELFFSKHLDWRDENEYRVVLYGDLTGEAQIPMLGALTHVAVGSKCVGAARRGVVEFCCRHNIDAAYLTWKNGYPEPMPFVWGGRQRFL
jgi:DUF2971 family protein